MRVASYGLVVLLAGALGFGGCGGGGGDGPPVVFAAADDSAMTDEDTPVVLNLLANDGMPNGSEVIALIAETELGLITPGMNTPVIGETTFVLSSRAEVTIRPDGTMTYDPFQSGVMQRLEAGAMRADSFAYLLTDGTGDTDIATVSIAVAGIGGVVEIFGYKLDVVEGSGGGSDVRVSFRITVEDRAGIPVPAGSTVSFTTVDGTAVTTGGGPGLVDYGSVFGFDSTWNGSMFTSTGEVFMSVDVVIAKDDEPEPNETFDFTASLAPALPGIPTPPRTVTVTIFDDD